MGGGKMKQRKADPIGRKAQNVYHGADSHVRMGTWDSNTKTRDRLERNRLPAIPSRSNGGRPQIYSKGQYLGAVLVVVMFLRAIFLEIPIDSFEMELRPSLTIEQGNSICVWTYPGPPEDTTLTFKECFLLCAYSNACRTMAGLQHFEFLNIRELARGHANFEKLIDSHMYYKIIYREMYLHHIQSIAVCSLLLQEQVVLPLGYLSNHTYLKSKCKSYDPTDTKELPLIRTEFVKTVDFAVLGYDSRVASIGSANSGDEIQAMAAAQWYPYVSSFVDRDQGFPEMSQGIHLIANAWYGVKSRFPPPINATEISFISTHFSGQAREHMITKQKAYWHEYTRVNGAIGARDTGTLDFLKSQGLEAYLSLCLTLTYQMPQRPRPGNAERKIYLVDVKPEYVPKSIVAQAEIIRCVVSSKTQKQTINGRTYYAHSLLQKYAMEGSLVITARIHSALPSLALGATVIFVEPEKLPGGGGGRTLGISNLFHHYTPKDPWAFDIEKPLGPAPGVHRVDRYRAAHWSHLKRKSNYYEDTARLYGMIPMKRLGRDAPISGVEHPHDLFHMILSEGPDEVDWMTIRAIESVFYHHPNAKVALYTKQSDLGFDNPILLFRESGYDLEIRPNNVIERIALGGLNSSIANGILKRLIEFATRPFLQEHYTQLLAYVLLYVDGGVYLDNDVYLQQTIPKSTTNFLGRENADTLNGAIMAFERRHPMLNDALEYILDNYTPGSMNGQDVSASKLLTSLQASYTGGHTKVVGLEMEAFLYLPGDQQESFCSREKTDFKLKQTIAVHLNLQHRSQYPKPGTLCDTILNQYCIFCNEVRTSTATNV